MQTYLPVAAETASYRSIDPPNGTFPSTASRDDQLIGAEIAFGETLIGRVEGLVRDPLSQRVRRLITSYGANRRRVGVPIEWVVNRSRERLVLGVGTRSLDDLGERP